LESYTLIIAEKPDAANRIASALDLSGKAQRMQDNGVPYFVANRNGKIVVVSALGHLYTVAGASNCRSQLPVLDYDWVPRFQAERGARRMRVWVQTITKLAKEAARFIDACDYDIEGSIIGYCILKYACGNKQNDAKRMKYSTMTSEALVKSYEELFPHLDFALIEAGLARHEVDWIYGINLSKALTRAAKNASGQYFMLSTGRVQGPTLKFLAARERNIACFAPTPYWTIKAKIKIHKAIVDAVCARQIIENKEEALAIAKTCQARKGEVETVQINRFPQIPPFPFDLGSLQTEAYRLFGYTPMRTSAIAQKLYIDALISYPRTSSQELPQDIGYEKILKNIAKIREFTRLSEQLLAKPELKPTQGKKQDSAHPAIYPTGKHPKKSLLVAERNIYNLVIRRFLAVFAEPAIKQTIKAIINLSGEKFVLSGKHTLEDGWQRFYEPYVYSQGAPLPEILEKQEVTVQKVVLEEKFTKPRSRYNPGSLLTKMEQEKIGTKATRAGILQTLYDRNYINGQRIAVTDLGFEVTDVLKQYCPTMISVEFTRKLEQKMEQIQQGNETKQKILLDAIEVLKQAMLGLKENEKTVGERLSCTLRKLKSEEQVIGACPTCQTGKLIIQYSKKTGKRFVGCTNYFNAICRTTFPLPQRGYLKPSGKACKGCGWSTVHVWFKDKRPWNLCLNSQCSQKRSGKKP